MKEMMGKKGLKSPLDFSLYYLLYIRTGKMLDFLKKVSIINEPRLNLVER